MINEQGGINGRKLNLIQYDDALFAAKGRRTGAQAGRGDEVLFTFQIIGTAVERRRAKISQRAKKVPQLLHLDRCLAIPPIRKTRRGPSALQSELPVRGAHLREIHPAQPSRTPGSASLYQNDDLGRDYITGLKSPARRQGRLA